MQRLEMTVHYSDDGVEIDVATDAISVEKRKELIQQELERFEKFFSQDLHNDALARPERAILSTYIAWKLGLGKESKSAP